MAFNPSSTIFLCNVPFDNTYKHQVYFATKAEQQNYFSGKTVMTFVNYLTVRKTLPNGSVQSSVKVGANIDDLYKCNYMYYQNANHGTKYFYAFIVNLIYINENTTEVVFETDVYQTWRFNVELKPSYVAREHSEVDIPGDNIVPEKFNFSEYDYHEVTVDDTTLKQWGYLVTSANPLSSLPESLRGSLYSGVYQGLYFYYWEEVSNLNNFLTGIEKEHTDCIVSITLVPKFNIADNLVQTQNGKWQEGPLMTSLKPAEKTIEVDTLSNHYKFGSLNPRNAKLYTYPFYKLVVTNHAGYEAEYATEFFEDERKAVFKMYGDLCPSPSVTLVPQNYKGVSENVDCGISLGGFPQCAYNADAYQLWLAKNQNSMLLDIGMSLGQTVVGAAMTYGTGGIGGVAGAGMMASGINGLLSTVAKNMDMKKEPNKYTTGSPKNNLLTAILKNKFDYYILTLKEDYAQTIDDFFTMYGYQTNRVKTPNVSIRERWNYVQTVDVNIEGAIPFEDMRALKAMYNNGVTFWKPSATMYDYTKSNNPTFE